MIKLLDDIYIECSPYGAAVMHVDGARSNLLHEEPFNSFDEAYEAAKNFIILGRLSRAGDISLKDAQQLILETEYELESLDLYQW